MEPEPEPEDRLAAIRYRKLCAARERTGMADTDDIVVLATVDRFFAQKINMTNTLVSQQNMKKEKLAPGVLSRIGEREEDWMKNWETISKNFDVLYWWVKVGRDLFPLIFPVAMSILSVPDSNGKQERTFSAATWMDCKLNKRQSMLTFQSKVLLHQNKGFLVRYKDDIQEAYKAQAERRTKAVLDLAAG